MKQTDEQRKELHQAVMRGYLLSIAESKGGTGELRKPLSQKEKVRRKKARKQARASRKFNRRKGA